MIATYLNQSQIIAAAEEARRAPKVSGTIDMLVIRRAVDHRERRQEVYLSPTGGMEGDRWAAGRIKDPENHAQIAVIGTRFLSRIAGGDPARMELAGDNLVIDMDLHEDNLPAGTQLKVGQVLLEVTPKPHLGCVKLSKRFGPEVFRYVNQKENRPLKLRGIYVQVLTAGIIREGDKIEKL